MDFHDDLLRTIEDGEIAESEEVHLEKSECFEWTCRELSHRRCRILRWWLQRAEMCDRLWSDDHRTGVDSELTNRSFHFEGCIDDFLIFLLTLIGFLEFRRFDQRF